MPSKSKSQQRFFGMVDAYKKGEMKNASSKIKKAAKGMSMDDVKDFAETKHKGLPEKVEETIIRLTESDLHRIVKESVDKILKEGHFDVRNYRRRGKMGNKLNKPLSDIDKEDIDVAKIAKTIFPDHTPQTAKDYMQRILYGESNLHRIVKESVSNVLKEGYYEDMYLNDE